VNAAPARVSRLSKYTALTAVSLVVSALAWTGHVEVALAITVPAYGWLQAQQHQRMQRVEASLGPANGENVHELLSRLIDLEAYTRRRNHDILGALTPPNARLELELLDLKDAAAQLLQPLLSAVFDWMAHPIRTPSTERTST
jgi:hypothetical protein